MTVRHEAGRRRTACGQCDKRVIGSRDNSKNNDHPRIICAWGDHELYDQPYECPYCRKIAMRFTETGTRFD